MDKNLKTGTVSNTTSEDIEAALALRLVAQPWRTVLLILGCTAVGLGTLGMFLPLLPTVPFLLLAAACFSRSSASLQHWLFHHKYLGAYLQNYLLRKGITKKQLIVALTTLWISMGIAILFIPHITVSILLVIIASLVSVHLLRLRRLA